MHVFANKQTKYPKAYMAPTGSLISLSDDTGVHLCFAIVADYIEGA